jgi:ubiquinone/menaquinone biosynthesis C-methylase UbiE
MTTAPAIDPRSFKNAAREQWDHAAAGWNEHGPQIRSWLRDATAAMIDMAGVTQGSRVLDVAAGAGDQTRDLVERVGPEGHVLAVDLSAPILELAQRNIERAGFRNVEFRVADGENLDVEDASFDAAVCRLGLMLFPEPLQGLREMHRALRPGGRACVMVFSTPAANPCLAVLMQTALKHAGMPPRDPYQSGSLMSLGRPGLIDDLFREAGFRAVATTRISAAFRLPSAADYLSFVRSSASPIQQILGSLDPGARQSAFAEMEEKLRAFDQPDGWSGPNELLLTTGHRLRIE